MICGLLICAAFTFGWWFGGWQVYRNWKKLAALSAKSLACADFWQKEFLNLLGKLEPMRMEAPVPPQYAKDSVCREIQEIMETYREQAASSYGVDTPGGLEHMGDVWRLLGQWDQALSRAGLANRNVDEEEYLRHTAHVVSNLPQPLSDSDRMWMNGYKQGWIAGWQTLSYSTPASPPKPTSAIDSAKR
jgi:hypothetical protein